MHKIFLFFMECGNKYRASKSGKKHNMIKALKRKIRITEVVIILEIKLYYSGIKKYKNTVKQGTKRHPD